MTFLMRGPIFGIVIDLSSIHQNINLKEGVPVLSFLIKASEVACFEARNNKDI